MIGKLRYVIFTLLVFTVSSAFATSVLGGSVLYVDDDAPAGGDGLTWETSYRFLQDALIFAAQPENGVSEIRVGQGVYKPDRDESNPGGTADREATFSLVSGVALKGGYAGIDAGNPDERDIEKFETILSGDLLGDDQPDFVNYEENSYRVSTASNMALGTSLEGFIIMSGNANVINLANEGGGLFVQGGSLTVIQCIFRLNRTISGWDSESGGSGIFSTSANITVQSSLFEDNWASKGGGIQCKDANEVTINDCTFTNNFAGTGAGIFASNVISLTVTGCSFTQNQTEAAGAGMFLHFVSAIAISDCNFVNNNGGLTSGGLVFDSWDSTASVSNCLFANNISSLIGGGAIVAGDMSFVNCSFSGNTSPWGGGLFSDGQANLINCTVGSNSANGIWSEDGNVLLANCIVWGNSPDQFDGNHGSIEASYCNIQGGYPGTGNIDVNPLFVNPGSNNLRLAFGSPCIDAGTNFLVPEGIEFDLDGDPRFVDDPDVEDTGVGTPPLVDMGAYEGAHESEDAQATEGDLDQGETVFLIPNGGGIDLLHNAMVIATNHSGPDDAVFSVTQIEWNPYPSASGFSELGSILRLETSLEDGQYFAQLFIPFELNQLNDLDPLLLDAINFHNGSGNWMLGTNNNTQDSPDRHGPIGDKISMINTGQGFGITGDLGDYGVLYDPKLETGFVWMNVDHAGDFGFGEQLCIADCQPYGGDGIVHVSDLLTLLSSWGLEGASDVCDVDRNDIVDEVDLLTLLSNWGLCSVEPAQGGDLPTEDSFTLASHRSRNNRNADLDNNGIIDRADIERLHAAWGPCAKGSPADLDADGKVSTSDLIQLLANWGQAKQ